MPVARPACKSLGAFAGPTARKPNAPACPDGPWARPMRRGSMQDCGESHTSPRKQQRYAAGALGQTPLPLGEGCLIGAFAMGAP